VLLHIKEGIRDSVFSGQNERADITHEAFFMTTGIYLLLIFVDTESYLQLYCVLEYIAIGRSKVYYYRVAYFWWRSDCGG
jgi:hypothetical protein